MFVVGKHAFFVLIACIIAVSIGFFHFVPRAFAAFGGPCACSMDPKAGPNYCPNVTCTQVTNGFTTFGKCTLGPGPQGCQGMTSSGQGGDMKGLQEALGIAKQIMDLLKGAGGGEGGGGGAGDMGFPTVQCPNGQYQVTTPTSDPCAIYNPNPISDILNGGTSNVSNSLLDALNGTNSTNTTSSTTNTATATTATSTNTSTQGSTTPVSVPTTTGSITPTGEIKLSSTGATIISNVKQGLTEVAGFFGGSTFGGSSATSAAGRMCASRPWAGKGIIAGLMPDTFFDSICSRAGYQVGVVTPTTSGTPVPSSVKPQQPKATTTQPQTPVSLGPVTVDIWAEPATVRLGSRTYVFWNARGVTSCNVTGPSFAHDTLSGGASTITISGPTTYSIECTAPDGTKATDSVTVQLAI